MKTLIEKYKAALNKIADPIKWMQDNLKEGESLNGGMAIRLANNSDWLRQQAKDALSSLESEIAELEQNNPALREELIAFAEFVNMKMPVITEKYIDDYLSSRQEKPNAKEPCQKSE